MMLARQIGLSALQRRPMRRRAFSGYLIISLCASGVQEAGSTEP